MTEKAAVESIEGILHMINTSAEKYLDAMFPEGISIQLLNFKTTQKGDERAKIGVDISHKGQKVKSLKSFSGGQRSRINLAFQLGLSNLYNCPFLLIDEGLTGVDTESHRECLEFLKEFSQQKLILIIEHHADRSLFDEEIVL
jgi:DNA repair exonuclease SbcCD ATPase subunit